jgi:hypothetical protein
MRPQPVRRGPTNNPKARFPRSAGNAAAKGYDGFEMSA